MSPIYYHGITVFDFASLFDCTQLIKEPKNKLGNLNLLLTDVPGVVDPMVEIILFHMQMTPLCMLHVSCISF